MTESKPDHLSTGADPDAENGGFERFVVDWLARAAPDLARAVYAAAVPHQFDQALFGALLDDGASGPSLLQRLIEAGVVAQTGQTTFFAVPSWFRRPLLRRLLDNDLVAFRALNRKAAAYLDALHDQPEVIFHLLGAGDPQAPATLLAACELAWRERMDGVAERLLNYAGEQQAALDRDAYATWRHLTARRDLMHGRYQQAESLLRELSDTTDIDPRLQARVLAAETELLLATNRWGEAEARASQAAALFAAEGDALNAAQLQAAQGDALLRLSTRLGGLPGNADVFETRWQAWLRSIQHAPFYLYRWMSRRISWLPNVYFGASYQDWIIVSLLFQAINFYRRALGYLGATPSSDRAREKQVETVLAADLRLQLADLTHRVGRWSVAERWFQQLADEPVVQANAYRRAILDLARGRAALDRSQYAEATKRLQAAHAAFSAYDDQHALATVNQLLGQAATKVGDNDVAAARYHESTVAAIAVHDLIEATHAGVCAAELAAARQLSTDGLANVAATDQLLQQRAYIARFSGAVLQRFRRLAVFAAAPLTYIVIWLLAGQMRGLATWLEIVYQRVNAQAAPGVEWLTNTLVFLAIPLLTLWLYETFYLVLGWFTMQRLMVQQLAERQPAYVVTTPRRIALRDEFGAESGSAVWSEIDQQVKVDRSVWRSPSALLSSTVLTAGPVLLILTGVLFHYEELKVDIARRLASTTNRPKYYDLSFSLLKSWWSILALAATIIMSVAAVYNLLDPASQQLNIWLVHLHDGAIYRLPVTTAISEFYIWALYFFPLFGLVHLLILRYRARRALGSRVSLGKSWPMWLAVAILILLTAAELWTFTR